MTEPNGAWSPPKTIPRSEVVRLSRETLALPDIPVGNREDIFRIQALDMDWDIGTMTYAPEDPARVPKAPDGRKAGIFPAARRHVGLQITWSPWPGCWPRSSDSRSR